MRKIDLLLTLLLIASFPVFAQKNGTVKGVARLVKDVSEMDKVKDGEILVSSRIYPDLLPAMKRSGAIIAELGGLLSHAAIVSRELRIPCLVGVRNVTSKIKDGDFLEINTVTKSQCSFASIPTFLPAEIIRSLPGILIRSLAFRFTRSGTWRGY